MSVKKAIPFGIYYSPKGNMKARGTKKKMEKAEENPGKSERNDDKNMRTMGCNNVVLSTNVFPYFVEDVSN